MGKRENNKEVLLHPSLDYPKRSSRLQRKFERRWQVLYDLAYDGGGGSWVGYYRTKTAAKIAAWYNYYIASWGGSAKLIDTEAK